MKKLFLLAVVASMFLTSCQEVQVFGEPKNTVSVKAAAGMIKEYRTTRKPAMDSIVTAMGITTGDAQEGVFDLEELENYINKVKNDSKAKRIPLTGFRFVYAAYPEGEGGEKSKYQTLVLLPATTIDGKPNVAFDPLFSSTGEPMSYTKLFAPYFGYTVGDTNSNDIQPMEAGMGSVFTTQTGPPDPATDGDGGNYNSMCPPICDPTIPD